MKIAQIFANAARNAQPAQGGIELMLRGSVGGRWDFSTRKMPTFFLLLQLTSWKTEMKCRDRKRVMNGLMPCDSTKSSLLAVMLLICLNLSHCNVAPTWERRIGCNCCLWGAAGSSQPPDMRAVFTGAGGRRSPSWIWCLLPSPRNWCETSSQLRGTTPDRPALIPHLPASACPQFWLKVVVPDECDEAGQSVLVSSIGHHPSSWVMSAPWPLQRNGHQALQRG